MPASPARASSRQNAAAEIDFYGGVRPTLGPLAFDFGYWYYYYPGGQCYGKGPLQALRPRIADLAAIPVNGNVAKSVASFYEVTPRPHTPGPIGFSE